MKIDLHTRLTAAAAVAGLAAAGVAASASQANCPPQASAQGQAHGCGTTHPTPGGQPQADPQQGILPVSAQAQPILGRSVTLGGSTGTVLVKTPTGTQFVPLTGGVSVPVGSTVDATHGAITLASVKDASGTVQYGRFWGGRFKVEQTTGAHPVTVLVLAGSLGKCPTRKNAVMSARRRSSRLWGRDHHGRYSTRGSWGAASVRGTEWLTQDTCSATTFRVTRGAIVVHDFHRHRNVPVTAGRSYTARR